MTADVSARWLLASRDGGARPITTVTAQRFGEDPVELTVDGCTVTKSLDSGARFQANISVVRVPNQGTQDLVLADDTIFTVSNGWNYGAGQTETIPLGTYEMAQEPKTSRSQAIPLALMDQWARLEECRLGSPVTVLSGASRTSTVTAQVLDAIPGLDIRILTSGGNLGSDATWDRDRTQLINDLSRDGSFLAAFAADGAFEIASMPTIGTPAATFVDGVRATILDVSTERTYTRKYNAVQMNPTDDQVWLPVTVQIDDPDHPRDPSKIGLRRYFATAPTAANAAVAANVGRQMLPRIIDTGKRVEVRTWGQAHLDPGDTFATVQSGTYADGAESDLWLAETVTHNCLTVESTIIGRSVTNPITEET